MHYTSSFVKQFKVYNNSNSQSLSDCSGDGTGILMGQKLGDGTGILMSQKLGDGTGILMSQKLGDGTDILMR
jgi:hypothetical protein